jgi:hypothetical protein
MIIYFSGSTRNIKQDIYIYRKIIKSVRSLGHSLHNDWVETEWLRESQRGKDGTRRPWDLSVIVEASEISIDASELVIAEASDVSTFGVGYEVALGLQRKKPVLALVRSEAVGESYVTGIKHDLLTIKKYDDAEVQKIVEDFIKANTLKNKDLRFNFVIDRHIYNHLRLKSFRSGKTKAEVVRDLLIDDMGKE